MQILSGLVFFEDDGHELVNSNLFFIQVGTKVFLKSLSSGNKDVVLATIVSYNPKYKLDGAEITNQFWAVHVNAALVKTEELVEKQKTMSILVM